MIQMLEKPIDSLKKKEDFDKAFIKQVLSIIETLVKLILTAFCYTESIFHRLPSHLQVTKSPYEWVLWAAATLLSAPSSKLFAVKCLTRN